MEFSFVLVFAVQIKLYKVETCVYLSEMSSSKRNDLFVNKLQFVIHLHICTYKHAHKYVVLQHVKK